MMWEVKSLVRSERVMNIIVISKRDDEYCYEAARNLYLKYGDEIFMDIFEELK